MPPRVPPEKDRAAFDTLIAGYGEEEAARAGDMTVQTLRDRLARGSPRPAPGIPPHIPWTILLDRIRRGVNVVEPLTDAEVVAASRILLAQLEHVGAAFMRVAAQLNGQTPTQAAPPGAREVK
jgi:hypothetical protein